ncbi:MAG TPA: serine/threonine-protein kinase [Rubricoccaceae bacterium]|nr:serine/threonine-protein kinase [Rubricoccaceae bacterium]
MTPFAELARGEAAVVYKGYQRPPGRTVLLKVLTPEAAADEALVAWFEGEARALGEVQHPNVVEVFEAGRADGRPYYVAEFVEGLSLAALLADGPLPPALAAYVAAEAARGLAAAHARGLLHRDLKPANVLVGHDGRVKLADFGLATRVAADGGDGAPAAIPDVRGTLGYLAPETVRGEAAGPAADLFALGATLAEALTGRPPFPTGAAGPALNAVLHHDPVPALQADLRLPEALVVVCTRLLAKRPEDRFPSAAEAAAALETCCGIVGAEGLAAFLEDPASWRAAQPFEERVGEGLSGLPASFVVGEPTAGIPAAVPVPARPFVPMRRAAGMGVVAAVLVGIVALAMSAVREGPDREATVLPAEPVLVTEIPAPDSLGPPATAPDQPPPTPQPLLPPDAAPPTAQEDPPVPVPSGEPEPTPPRSDPPPEDPIEPRPDTRPGVVVVRAEPWAEVTINGAPVGQTPVRRELAPGMYRIVLRNPRFPEYATSVTVRPGEETPVPVSLWQQVGQVWFEVSPWAEVSVDGQVMGTIPPQTSPLPLAPGAHAVRLRHPTLGTHNATIEVAAGQRYTFRYNLTQLLGGSP